MIVVYEDTILEKINKIIVDNKRPISYIELTDVEFLQFSVFSGLGTPKIIKDKNGDNHIGLFYKGTIIRKERV
jgi:hypothetical protein